VYGLIISTGIHGCKSSIGIQWNMCRTGVVGYRNSTGVHVCSSITGVEAYRSSLVQVYRSSIGVQV